MSCNTQRAAKKQDFIFLPSWVAFWLKEQAHFVPMKYFKCPSNNLEIVKGFYLLSSKRLFSTEKNNDISKKAGTSARVQTPSRAKRKELRSSASPGWSVGVWHGAGSGGEVLFYALVIPQLGGNRDRRRLAAGGHGRLTVPGVGRWRQEMETGDEYR